MLMFTVRAVHASAKSDATTKFAFTYSNKFFCCHAASIWRVSYKKQKVWSSSVYLVEGSDKTRNE